jgi:hypothetical protein
MSGERGRLTNVGIIGELTVSAYVGYLINIIAHIPAVAAVAANFDIANRNVDTFTHKDV